METQTTTKPNGKYPLGPKYDTTTRIKVRRRIKELARNGLPYAKIAQVMSTEGFKTPAGAPVTKTLVSNQANAMGIKKHKLNKKTKNGLTLSERQAALTKREARAIETERAHKASQGLLDRKVTNIALIIEAIIGLDVDDAAKLQVIKGIIQRTKA